MKPEKEKKKLDKKELFLTYFYLEEPLCLISHKISQWQEQIEIY